MTGNAEHASPARAEGASPARPEGASPARAERAAAALLEARATRRFLPALPEGTAPRSEAEAYAIQDLVAARLGPVAGWKVGAQTPASEPFASPLHAATIRLDDTPWAADRFQVVGVEAEIAYLLGRDLPPREAPYTDAEVLDAVASLHPAIEIADTRHEGWGRADRLSHLADQGGHGALILGPAVEDWRRIVPVAQPVRVTVNGVVIHEGVGGNSAGDPVRMLRWLADGGAARLGGLRRGQVVTTGSMSGCILSAVPARIRAEFAGMGAVETSVA
ncbi:fumarylacetoacetate hydrolase family protein [Roseomonas sp. NAR14]|uniref:Fumarylacetoacetate hydrolase family protein n=1 Tax=Roseomonas acroporae TaxID=2937791 RepID=A0A9X1Y3N0_9PROT|nr:fumarylacetoacetate hydrolase family protein [Roseomonas acroporae]MCK8783384.1 fumarylacetoacetate hydrolase family protein [Roseomonas acroporae]